MAVTKRTRYEVLRRDSHTCRYCGASAPEATLTVDHVIPVALGGSDEPSNLVAACRDCNAGKASSAPDAALVDDVEQDILRWARAMRTAIDEAMLAHEKQKGYTRAFLDVWEQFDPEMEFLPTDFDGMLNYWHRIGIPSELVTEALYVAWGKSHLPARAVFRYTIGILRNQIAEIQERAGQLLTAEEGGSGE